MSEVMQPRARQLWLAFPIRLDQPQLGFPKLANVNRFPAPELGSP